MTIRRYLSELIGDGTHENPYRPAVADLIPATRPWSGCDGRNDPTLPAGTMMVEADVTDTQHATVSADPRVQSLAIEDASGVPVAESAPITAIPLAKRNAVRALLVAQHVPFDDFTGTNTVGDVLKRIRRRFLIRQILKRDDLDELFSMTLAEIPDAKRARIRLWLWERGFDVSVLQATDTVEEALRKLLNDPVLDPPPRGAARNVQNAAPTPPRATNTPTTPKRSANGRKRKR